MAFLELLACWLSTSLAVASAHQAHAPEVYLMMPLTLVNSSGQIEDPDHLEKIFDGIQEVGADGFMVDVWWGITEPTPMNYTFEAYKELVKEAKVRNLKVQMVGSFHQCGGNIGDACYIPLPEFVREKSDIWYKDAQGGETQEYISLFADAVPVDGRTPLQMYSDWFAAFSEAFAQDLGDPIVEVMVGLGPCGEMRYPSYPLDRWSFPGIGEFQCHDKHALESLRLAAEAAGCDGCGTPPETAGTYNDQPKDTEFFTTGYSSPSGRFFLDWYSGALKAHGANILKQAGEALGPKVKLSAKISGLHWWHNSSSHAAELTAGYYNTNDRNAYLEIAEMLLDSGAEVLDFTCLEMRNIEQPAAAASSPQELVQQVIKASKDAGIAFSGENALQRYDQRAYEQMLSYKDDLHSLTYLRITDTLLTPREIGRFRQFVSAMHAPAGEVHELSFLEKGRQLRGAPMEPIEEHEEPMEGLAFRREHVPRVSGAFRSAGVWLWLLPLILRFLAGLR
mmetsp:Transcript_24021/g.56537  ORF Transcript_24021/g.56537 Transcript_24021/m.56537 type:complete len:507 (-) Transcript_24021:82-1602(-)